MRRLVELEVLELVAVRDVALGLRGLALERAEVALDLGDDVADAQQVLLRQLHLPLGLLLLRLLNLVMPAASSMSRRRSSGFALTMRPILPCSTIEYAFVPTPVPRNRSVTSFRRTWRLVDQVLAVAVAVEAARDRDLGVVAVFDAARRSGRRSRR